jgi:hypothetical protein
LSTESDGFVLASLFDPEDIGGMASRDVGLSPKYRHFSVLHSHSLELRQVYAHGTDAWSGTPGPYTLCHLIKRVLLTTIAFGALAFALLKDRVAKYARVSVNKIFKTLDYKFVVLYYPSLSCINFLQRAYKMVRYLGFQVPFASVFAVYNFHVMNLRYKIQSCSKEQ